MAEEKDCTDLCVGAGALKVKHLMPKSAPGACACCCTSVVFLIMIILFFPATVTQLGQYKLGLAKNKITGVVNMGSTYTPGRYWIGFWKEFVEFPSVLCTIEFSDETPEEGVQTLGVLRSRDKGGHQMYLDVSIQYQLIPENIGQIYREMTVHYEDVYISELRDALSKAGNNFNASLVWNDYAAVSEIMKQACINVLIGRHANCWGLQLWGIRLQRQYEEKLIQTQVRKQAQRTETARLNHAVVRVETEVLLAEYRRNITVIQGYAEAQKYTIIREAKAQADANIIAAHAEALTIVKEELKVNSSVHGGEIGMNESELVEYQKIIMLQGQKDAHFVYHATGGDVMESVNQFAAKRIMDDEL